MFSFLQAVRNQWNVMSWFKNGCLKITCFSTIKNCEQGKSIYKFNDFTGLLLPKKQGQKLPLKGSILMICDFVMSGWSF